MLIVVDQSKESSFKVAPSKWEAVDESELASQGNVFLCIKEFSGTLVLAVDS